MHYFAPTKTGFGCRNTSGTFSTDDDVQIRTKDKGSLTKYPGSQKQRQMTATERKFLDEEMKGDTLEDINRKLNKILGMGVSCCLLVFDRSQ